MYRFDGKKKTLYSSLDRWALASSLKESSPVIQSNFDLNRPVIKIEQSNLMKLLYTIPLILSEDVMIVCPTKEIALNNYKLHRFQNGKSYAFDTTVQNASVLYFSADHFINIVFQNSSLLRDRRIFLCRMGELEKIYPGANIIDADLPIPLRFREPIKDTLFPLSTKNNEVVQREYRRFVNSLNHAGDLLAYRLNMKTVLAAATILELQISFFADQSYDLTRDLNCFWDYQVFYYENSEFNRMMNHGPFNYLEDWATINQTSYPNSKEIIRFYTQLLEIVEETTQELTNLSPRDIPAEQDAVAVLQISDRSNVRPNSENTTMTQHSKVFPLEVNYAIQQFS